ncbi:MAG: DUF3089 domain-containing protein [Gemmatimonadetes bacterium]|nr:DUF3089 domain-containing protein [Gemmatimonadota bacterium]
MTRRVLALCGVFALWTPCVAAVGAQAPAVAAGNDYALAPNWLCRPGRNDACAVDLATTVIAANGTLTREAWTANPDAPIDCFYVYPTVSRDTTPNSDMIPGPEERGVILQQFARFASECKPYAPLYRQITIPALFKALSGAPVPMDRVLAYTDVRDAWRYYLEHDNNGRGVVLIGHSQGAGVLTQLLHDEIDGKPAQARLVSALLMGTNLPVPQGKDVGGALAHIPLCHTATQTGCVITYVSFRAESPPPPNTKFGRVAAPGMVAGCVNPAAPGGGSGALQSYFATGGGASAGNLFDIRNAWLTPPQPIPTPFVSVPGLLTAECVSSDAGSYLAITVHPDPTGPRTKTLAGDVVIAGQVKSDWGLHLIDMSAAMGNLVGIVGTQSRAFMAARGK